MIGARQRQFVERKTEPVPPCVLRAVVQLAEAHDYARDVQAELWQYAVEIESLMVTGAGVEDLQWLVQGGYVEHAREVTRPKDAARRFVASQGSSFAKRTCFVLTAAGLRLTCVMPAQMPQRRAA